jgi:hypothetical protein
MTLEGGGTPMKKLWIVTVMAFLVTGCLTTTVNEEWKEPGSNYAVHSVVVLGMPLDTAIGHQCSDTFVKELNNRGILATPGYNMISASATKEKIMATAKGMGRQGVVICRFLERRSQIDVYPREPVSRFDYEMWGSNEYVENSYDVFGTNLYDSATGRLVWSANSDTYAGGSAKKVVESYVKTMVKKMEKEGLIRAERQ